MELTTQDTNTKFTVSDEVFSVDFNETLIHQTVTTFQANARSGNSAQKTRSEVSGGGKKPWKQKGTGRARAGTIRSPIWRSGGVTFAAKKRDYSKKLNKKMYRTAIRSIVSELIRANRLIVLSNFECADHKTKTFRNQTKELGISNGLIVMKDIGENEYLASRNCRYFDVSDVEGIDPVNLLRFEQVVFTEEALKQFEERLA